MEINPNPVNSDNAPAMPQRSPKKPAPVVVAFSQFANVNLLPAGLGEQVGRLMQGALDRMPQPPNNDNAPTQSDKIKQDIKQIKARILQIQKKLANPNTSIVEKLRLQMELAHLIVILSGLESQLKLLGG